MGSRPPTGPLFLRPGWVPPAWPDLPDQIFPAELPTQTQTQDAPGWLVGSFQPVPKKIGGSY